MLLNTHNIKPSIIQLRVQPIIIEQDSEWIISIIMQKEAELINGAILNIDAKKPGFIYYLFNPKSPDIITMNFSK